MFDIESLLIYGSVLSVSCLFAHFYDTRKYKFCLFLSYFCVAFFCAIRYDVGFDYGGYIDIFETIQSGQTSYVEPGYYVLNVLFAHNPNGYLFVLGIMSFATYGFLFAVFKWMKNVTWNVFFLFTFQLLFQINSQVRQGLAIALFFCALYCLNERKYWTYVGIILIGTLFHYSIAVFLLLLPIRNFGLHPNTWIILMISTFVVSLTGIFERVGNLILTNLPFYMKYLTYGDRMNAESHTNVLIVFFWVSVGIIIAAGHKFVSNKQMLNLYLLSVTLYPIFVPYHLIERILLYLMFLNGFLAADICRRNKVLGNILFMVALLVFFLYCLNNWGLAGGYPYYTIFGDHLIT